MSNTEIAITTLLALVISFGLLVMVCIDRNNLSDKEKGSIIICSLLFGMYSLLAMFFIS